MQVDCDEHKDLAKKYGVSGFPTLKLLKEGKPTDYNGGRTADDIVKFVIKKSGPAAKVREGRAQSRCEHVQISPPTFFFLLLRKAMLVL